MSEPTVSQKDISSQQSTDRWSQSQIRVTVREIIQILNRGLFEREETIKKTLLASIAGESIFFYGPPGVAKSLISRRIKHVFRDATSFEYLMNRFSTPEEIFGPISVSKLRDEDKLERKVKHYLPDADIAFLDEIWKAGPSIQNTLLTIINERIFRNGTQVIEVPLITLIAASNELPDPDQGLEALWDRFIIRQVIHNVDNKSSFDSILTNTTRVSEFSIPDNLKISDQQYSHLHEQIRKIDVPSSILDVLFQLRERIFEYNANTEDTRIYVSDRRWKKITWILKTATYLNGRSEVNLVDCYLVENMIWDELDQLPIINTLVEDSFSSYFTEIETIISELDDQIDTLHSQIQSGGLHRKVSAKFEHKLDDYNIFHLRVEFEGSKLDHPELARITYIYNWQNKFNRNWIPQKGDVIGLCTESLNHVETMKIIETDFSNNAIRFKISKLAQAFLIKLKSDTSEGSDDIDDEAPSIGVMDQISKLKLDIRELEEIIDEEYEELLDQSSDNLFIPPKKATGLISVLTDYTDRINQFRLRIEEIEMSDQVKNAETYQILG